MESLRAQFPDLEVQPLASPEQHPVFISDGFKPSKTTLPVGHVKNTGRKPFGIESIFEKDVAVTMADGATLYTDVYRPATSDGPTKVPALIAWSPYGKAGGCQSYEVMGPFRCGVPLEQTSGYEKFEGPDPADWCQRGYAIINIDARGAGYSEGDIFMWGPHESLDIHSTIEWVSKQPWCNGSVAMSGNSWLAIAQLNYASRHHHPALKAIAPWEGSTDTYRDIIVRGGIPRCIFWDKICTTLAGNGGIENASSMVSKRPLFDDYWQTKVIPVEHIQIPMYLTASYSTGLHSRGSFDAFVKAKTDKKWLRVHPYQEWYDLYRPENVEELQKFFDHYCKNVSNDWESTPRFRLSLLDFTGSPHGGNTILERPQEDWPVPGTENRKYFLDSGSHSLSTSQTVAESKTHYEAHHMTDCADFTTRFDNYTEAAGYPVVKLWVSCDEHDDMDIVVQIRKISADGTPLASLNYPCPVPERQVPNTNVVKCIGPEGMLRASHRVSKEVVDGRPWYRHDKAEKIKPGEVVELEIPIWPIGMVFQPGEGILVRVAGHDLRHPEFEGLMPDVPVDENIGRHVIHTGGKWDSYLLLPIIAEK